MTNKNIGILLTNSGTPDDLNIRSVRKYLSEFLGDKRVVHLPRFLWLPLLHGIILQIRPYRSLHLYQKIWRKEGSPMRVIMEAIVEKLREKTHYAVEIGMNYGNPSIPSALEKLHHKNIHHLIVLPLYPQYSNTTTASSYDRISSALKHWKKLPAISFINQYADHQAYIQTLSAKITNWWKEQGRSAHLLISFHGIPKRYGEAGDPYESQCQLTATLLAKELNLKSDQWTLCYQSKFGYDHWLTPSTQSLLTSLPQKNVKQIDVVCPGFAVDCLETLEEIAITGCELFKKAGGKVLRYIPALNDQDEHINLLMEMLQFAINQNYATLKS